MAKNTTGVVFVAANNTFGSVDQLAVEPKFRLATGRRTSWRRGCGAGRDFPVRLHVQRDDAEVVRLSTHAVEGQSEVLLLKLGEIHTRAVAEQVDLRIRFVLGRGSCHRSASARRVRNPVGWAESRARRRADADVADCFTSAFAPASMMSIWLLLGPKPVLNASTNFKARARAESNRVGSPSRRLHGRTRVQNLTCNEASRVRPEK
ncbi:MAG: hypothetical protein U1G08_00560 [Verrucomicrobiota bacterium]